MPERRAQASFGWRVSVPDRAVGTRHRAGWFAGEISRRIRRRCVRNRWSVALGAPSPAGPMRFHACRLAIAPDSTAGAAGEARDPRLLHRIRVQYDGHIFSVAMRSNKSLLWQRAVMYPVIVHGHDA
ncbi:hypothetical protein F1559_003463 [Cyanidiococcus yangmingshanensis]|uniref:Uncharacterized protein n=1 Tax=Cyanidiococcus yangmingshanensis TaxID=2690220 RepID=A0A7J7IKX2_9RHOD|nr:hypothetical protein F1559_003463 [Cyanidiococcus yangmingshanensis]